MLSTCPHHISDIPQWYLLSCPPLFLHLMPLVGHSVRSILSGFQVIGLLTPWLLTSYSCMPWLLIPWIDNQLKTIMYYLIRTLNPSLFCMFQCSMCGFLFLGCLPRIHGKLSAWLWSGNNLYLVIYTTYCVVCVPMSKVPQPYRCHCISVCPFC